MWGSREYQYSMPKRKYNFELCYWLRTQNMQIYSTVQVYMDGLSILILTIPVSSILSVILCHNHKITQKINFCAQQVTLVRLNETNEVGAFPSFYVSMDVDTALTCISARQTKCYIYINNILYNGSTPARFSKSASSSANLILLRC